MSIAWKPSGSITSGGSFSVYGESDVVFPSDADYIVPSGDGGGYDALTLIVSGSISTTRALVLPLHKGRPWLIRNTTSQTITAIGSTGTGATIAAGATFLIYTDGTNFYSSGGAATITLTGDTTGSGSSGTISTTTSKVNGATAPAAGALTTGNVLKVSGSSALTYGPVDLANANAVTGTLPTGNQAAQSLGGSLSGTTASGTVVQVDGSGSTDEFGGTGAKANIPATETVMASGGNFKVRSFVENAQTTDGTTWVTIATFSPSTNSVHDWSVSLVGINTAYNGDFYRADLNFTSFRATSAPTYTPSTPGAGNIRTSGGGTAYAIQAVVSGNNTLLQVKGAASTTVNWSVRGVVARAS